MLTCPCYIYPVAPVLAQHFKVKEEGGQFKLNIGDSYGSLQELIRNLQTRSDGFQGIQFKTPAPKDGESAPVEAVTDSTYGVLEAVNSNPYGPMDTAAAQGTVTANPPGTKEVSVWKNGGSLGMSIAGRTADPNDKRVGNWISKVKPDSPAIGLFAAPVRIFSIDGIDVSAVDKFACVDVLKGTGDTVKFVISADADHAGYALFDKGAGKIAKGGAAHQPKASIAPGTKQVKIDKNGGSLGMALAGNTGNPGDNRVGIWISKIKPGSPATGKIAPQTRVFAVDGQDMTNATKPQCVDVLTAAGAVVAFTVAAQPDPAGFAPFAKAAKPVSNPNTQEVTINKGTGSLGLSLLGPKTAEDAAVGIWIARVKPGSASESVVQPQCRIFSIDGKDVTAASKSTAIAYMKGTGAMVKLVISAPDEAGFLAFKATYEAPGSPVRPKKVVSKTVPRQAASMLSKLEKEGPAATMVPSIEVNERVTVPGEIPYDPRKKGRIQTIFNVDEQNKSLWVKICQVRGLQLGNAARYAKDASLHVRLFLLPSDDTTKLETALLHNGIPQKRDGYRQWTVPCSVNPGFEVEEVRQFLRWCDVPCRAEYVPVCLCARVQGNGCKNMFRVTWRAGAWTLVHNVPIIPVARFTVAVVAVC